MLTKTALTCLRTFKPSPRLAIPAFRFSQSQPNPFDTSDNVKETLSTNHFISKNVGLNRFMQSVYNTTGLSILGALGTSYIALSLPLTAATMGYLSIGGFAASLVGLIGSSYMKPEYLVISEKLNDKEKT